MEIVHMIQEGRDKEQIKLCVMNDYVCDESTFEKDYYDFTTMLRNHKLILATSQDNITILTSQETTFVQMIQRMF
jgi:hypothetical protein